MSEKPVHSVTKTIALAAFSETTEEVMADFFSSQELTEIAEEPKRTKAGLMAVKKALAELLMSITSSFDIAEKEIVLSHKPNGAPYIVSLPPLISTISTVQKEQLHVSISHTQHTAYAVAVYQGETHE